MKRTIFVIFIISFVVLNSLFIVNERQMAMVFQFGEAVKRVDKPGLTFKIPLIQQVKFFDKRLLNLRADEKEVIAKDQKRLIVNAFAKYKIIDPLKFFQTVHDELGAAKRLNSLLDSSLRQVLGEVPLSALLTDERSKIMQRICDLATSMAQSFGIEVVDVRIMRADLPKENSLAIYKRMQTDREKAAKEFRAQGAEEAQRVRSEADKERKLIISGAERDAQYLQAEGDTIAYQNYANAYSVDPDFYGFYRSMQAYTVALQKDNTNVIISPENDFLKYFKNY